MNDKNNVIIGTVHTHTHTHTHGIFKGILKLIAFLLILVICFKIINEVTKRKYAYQKMDDFFRQEQDFDVLFFGSSHMINGVFPIELWEEYGMVSYNMGNHNETIAITYYNMLLSLQETKPKIIVIDTYMASLNTKVRTDRKSNLHNLLDAYPISYTKYATIKDLFEEKESLERNFEFLFEFSLYHSRWKELTKNDFKYDKTYEKGAESKIKVASADKMEDYDNVEAYNDEETINIKYLKKIIEHCKNNDIDIIVTNIPYIAPNEKIAMSKYVRMICDEYNVKYIDFLQMNVIDYSIDCYDEGHLNPSGARKVTEYLGKYIKENYDIADQRLNKAYDFWNEDYNEYIDLKISNLKKNESNLNNYLMLLYGEEDIKYDIEVSSKRKIEEGSVLQNLLENINNNYKIDDTAFEEKKDKTIKITTWDKRDGRKIATVWF